MNLLQWFGLYAGTVILNYIFIHFHNIYTWKEQRPEDPTGIFNIRAIQIVVAWIPIYNMYLCWLMARDIIIFLSHVRMLRKVAKMLKKKHPDNEDIDDFYKEVHKAIKE